MRKYCVLSLFAFLIGCVSDADINVEKARFALDDSNWNSAISYAQTAFDRDPGNARAALIMSSAYAGRGGFRLLELIDVVASDMRRHDLFDAMQDALSVVESLDTADLRLAIEILVDRVDPEPEWNIPLFVDYNFQAAFLMIIEVYAKAALSVQGRDGDPILVEAITEEVKDLIVADLIGFDDRLVAAGVPEDDLMTRNTRMTSCVLRNASTGPSGVDLSALRDLIKCQLSPNDGTELTQADFESATMTSCADFDYDGCESAGDTEL